MISSETGIVIILPLSLSLFIFFNVLYLYSDSTWLFELIRWEIIAVEESRLNPSEKLL